MIYQLIGRLRLSILLKEKVGNLLTCKRIHNLGIWISHFCQYQHRNFKLSIFFFSASNVLQPNNVPCRNIWDVKEGCKIWDVKGPRSGVVAVRRYPTPKVRSSGCALLDQPCGETPHPRAKEKPQQDSRRGKITFTIKPHTHQRCSEGLNKPCVHQSPHRDWDRTVFECLLQRYGSAVDSCTGRGSGCNRPGYGITPLGGGHH